MIEVVCGAGAAAGGADAETPAGWEAGAAAAAPVAGAAAGVWLAAPVVGKSSADADIDAVNATKAQAARCGARRRASKVGTRHDIMNFAF